MGKRLGKYLSLTGSILLFMSSAACAGIYWESEVTSKGLPGQPDGTRTEKHYMTEGASRMELGNGSVIITNFDTMTTYHLNPAEKTYMEMKMDNVQMPGKVPPGMDEKMKEAMGQGMQVTPTDEKKTIEGYECRKYIVSFMQMKGEYWVSKDVKGYRELKAIGEKVGKAWEKSPMMRQMNMEAIVRKLDGFPVRTVMNVMGGQTISTLKRVDEKNFSDDLFSVPRGYKLVPMGKMGRP